MGNAYGRIKDEMTVKGFPTYCDLSVKPYEEIVSSRGSALSAGCQDPAFEGHRRIITLCHLVASIG